MTRNQYFETGDVLPHNFCRFSDSTNLSSERLLGALVSILLRNLNDGIPIPVSLNTLSNRYRTFFYPSLEELQEGFYDLCQHYSRVFLTIDGLDEIIDRSGNLKFEPEL
jgi:hypothetical protein